MLSTLNGCTCHFLDSEQIRSGLKCISCRGRSERPHKCKECKVGVWNSFGDYEGYNGLCSQCYEDKNPPTDQSYYRRY